MWMEKMNVDVDEMDGKNGTMDVAKKKGGTDQKNQVNNKRHTKRTTKDVIAIYATIIRH